MFRKLYGWVLKWADSPHGVRALFFLAFAVSSFFPVPPDILLIALVLSRPKRWIYFWAVCLLGSVLGGIAGYLIGVGVWEAAHPFFYKYVFSESVFETVKQAYNKYDYWVVFTAGFTPIPYKVFTIAGGVCQINFIHFLIASVLSRGGRFLLVAALLRIFGDRIKSFIDKYFNLLTVIFVILLIGGFVVLKYFWR